MRVIKVPNSSGPVGLCWKTGPDDTPQVMCHCTFKRGHKGPHQWQKLVDEYYAKVTRARDISPNS